MADVDDYQLPATILGVHPDEFYGAVGRVVCVCAVLEDQVTTLRHTLANARQGESTHEPISSQVRAARALSRTLSDHAGHAVEEFLDAVQSGFLRRNDLVHSSFPAQADGRLWGHRPTRVRTVKDATPDTVETSLEDLRAFIGQLSGLVRSFNGVHALATTGPRA